MLNSLILSPNPPVQLRNLHLVGYETRFAAVGTALLHGYVAVLSFPEANVWVVGAFGGLGVDVARIFDEAAAVSTHIAKLAVLANIDLVFADVPQVFESWFIDGFFQSGIFNVTEALSHGWTVLDVALRVNAYLAVEAGVVMLGFGEKGEVNCKILSINSTTVCCKAHPIIENNHPFVNV